MRRTILILNVAIFVFGIGAAVLAPFSNLIYIVVGCGVIAAVATGLTVMLNAWETFRDTPYTTFFSDNLNKTVLLTPRGKKEEDGTFSGATFADGVTPTNFRKWLFGKR